MAENLLGVEVGQREWSELHDRYTSTQMVSDPRATAQTDELADLLEQTSLNLHLTSRQIDEMAVALDSARVMRGTVVIAERWLADGLVRTLDDVYKATGLVLRRDPFGQWVSTDSNWLIRKSRKANQAGTSDGWSVSKSDTEEHQVFPTLSAAKDYVLTHRPRVHVGRRVDIKSGDMTTICPEGHVWNHAAISVVRELDEYEYSSSSDACGDCGYLFDSDVVWYTPTSQWTADEVDGFFANQNL
jgi:hypothetical protein